jgi:hypothetical protein
MKKKIGSRKSVEWIKSYSIFPKSIFAKIPFFHQPYHFFSTVPEQGAFWETKNLFGNHYPITLKNAQKTRILKQFFKVIV